MEAHRVVLVKGHQVASGLANHPLFLNGTINAQRPHFEALGLSLECFFPATLNIKFDCQKVELSHADFHFKKVKWHSSAPAEDFKFFICQLWYENTAYQGLVYQPQVSTKIAHFQPENQLEILAPYIKNIAYGDTLYIKNSSITLQY
jgi:hypothetical protein